MSYRITKSDFTEAELEKIKEDLTVRGAPNDYGPAKVVPAWRETVTYLFVPFAYSRTRFGVSPNKELPYNRISVKFLGDFRNDLQREVYAESMAHLKKHRTVLLSAFCGLGKTFLGGRFWQESGLKGLVLCHRKMLITQWRESVERFTDAKVQVLDTTTPIDPTAHFYIMNMATVPKRPAKDYADIGFLIVDEAHICCAEHMSRSLTYVRPRMCLALTATPKRPDGCEKLLDHYFSENKVVRIADSPFKVIRLKTDFVPEIKQNSQGRPDWGSVVKHLEKLPERNQLIVDLVKQYHGTKTMLILTKHVAHVHVLEKMIKELGIEVTSMCGTDQTYDNEADVLISTYSKLGVGFDDTRLDLLILAMSVKEVEQYAGRLRDLGDGRERIVIDIIDDWFVLERHWMLRKAWYLSRKGIVSLYRDPKGKKNGKTIELTEPKEASPEPQKRLAKKF